jgi:hypothetical protein
MPVITMVASVAGLLVVAIVVALTGLSLRTRHAHHWIDAPAFRVPPGWYPDPTTDDCQRWWDGMTWTDQAIGGSPPV